MTSPLLQNAMPMASGDSEAHSSLFSPICALAGNLRFLISSQARHSLDRRLDGDVAVPLNYFGLCVASQPDPAVDDFLINELRTLGIRAVRMDISLPDTEAHALRLLERLIEAGFEICLHPVYQPAGAEPTSAEMEHRQQALESLLDRVGDRIAILEIGATVNRRKWRDSSLNSYLKGYAVAYRAARLRGITVAGPNVTDFEPVYNVALLDAMRSLNCLPRFHSDNLFVERAGEPEQFDHKIAGRRAANLLKFDLIRKARILQAVGQWAGVAETICTHTAWSLRRIARFAGDIESKQADYVSRYCALAAACGALRQVYWGPLIGQREGLIDDGTDEYPAVLPHVTRYTRIPGHLGDYRRRPAWAAFQTIVAQLQGAVFAGSLSQDPSLFILAFDGPKGRLHVVWTRDGQRAVAEQIYPRQDLAGVLDRDGQRLNAPPATLSESPTFWLWPPGVTPIMAQKPCILDGIRFQANDSATDYHRFTTDGWQGIIKIVPDAPLPEAAQLNPSTWAGPESSRDNLRDARNRVWIQDRPWASGDRVVIKQLGAPRGFRILLQCFKPTRARRSWNGAVELRRRGLPTPQPIAFIERIERPALRQSYFICDLVDTPHSVRSFFTAYAEDQPAPAKIDQAVFFERLADFVAEMHRKGVFFRDFSAGNILVVLSHAGAESNAVTINFTLIDTARARFFPSPLDQRRRLSDLMRICHPLDARRRRQFLTAYLSAAELTYRAWMEWPFQYYNAKHRLKKWLRRRGKA